MPNFPSKCALLAVVLCSGMTQAQDDLNALLGEITYGESELVTETPAAMVPQAVEDVSSITPPALPAPEPMPPAPAPLVDTMAMPVDAPGPAMSEVNESAPQPMVDFTEMLDGDAAAGDQLLSSDCGCQSGACDSREACTACAKPACSSGLCHQNVTPDHCAPQLCLPDHTRIALPPPAPTVRHYLRSSTVYADVWSSYIPEKRHRNAVLHQKLHDPRYRAHGPQTYRAAPQDCESCDRRSNPWTR
ncbi:MAG: hypothetical protein AAGA03_00575 [Planctomycetota bacterium]